MVGSVPPSNPRPHGSDPSESDFSASIKGKSEFKVSPEFKKMWLDLFKQTGYVPTDKEIAKMTDQFINQVWNSCNHVLQHALANLKKLEKRREEEDGS